MVRYNNNAEKERKKLDFMENQPDNDMREDVEIRTGSGSRKDRKLKQVIDFDEGKSDEG